MRRFVATILLLVGSLSAVAGTGNLVRSAESTRSGRKNPRGSRSHGGAPKPSSFLRPLLVRTLSARLRRLARKSRLPRHIHHVDHPNCPTTFIDRLQRSQDHARRLEALRPIDGRLAAARKGRDVLDELTIGAEV